MRRGLGRLPPPPSWAAEIATVGVTGTNGKTTTTLFTAAALAHGHGRAVAATTIGTFALRRERLERLEVGRDHAGFIAAMAAGRAAGARHAAIELTSEALAAGYARAWPCHVGVFTNLSRDHLDAHGSAEHYLASKAQLFMHLPPGGAAILNAGDAACALLEEVLPEGVQIVRYAIDGEAALCGREVQLSWRGTSLRLDGSPGLEVLFTRGVGAVFAANALAAFAAAVAMGVAPAEAAEALAATAAPPGRFELVAEAPEVVVDYAHTPEALRETIATARGLSRGAVVAVFGAGGERDRHKRPLMGEAAAAADRIWLTSDNPRGEDSARIAGAIAEGLAGHPEVRIELDRARAIERAIAEAAPEDLIVIAGKGHETTQQVGAVLNPFDDREAARHAHARR